MNYDVITTFPLTPFSVIGVAVGGVLAAILLGVLMTASICAIILSHRLTKKASK